MPKCPQGQKRPANAVANAVMVAQTGTGKVMKQVDYTTSKRGSASGIASAKQLSADERQSIAKSSALAKWSEERRVNMTHQERLMTALFENSEREHVDIKFWLGGGIDLTADDVFREAANMLEQMDKSDGDSTFVENFGQREVAEFIASV
jgi:coproporphyrinogen III oxidase